MKNVLMSALALAIVLASCKKSTDSPPDTNPVPQAKSKTQLLTQKPWKDSIVLKRPDNTSSWIDANPPACGEDDITTFKTALTFTIDNGPTKCYSTQPQEVENGTWNFMINETHINYVTLSDLGASFSQDWTIDQLDEKILMIEYPIPGGGGTYKITMVH